jgi:hypothetical protein
MGDLGPEDEGLEASIPEESMPEDGLAFLTRAGNSVTFETLLEKSLSLGGDCWEAFMLASEDDLEVLAATEGDLELLAPSEGDLEAMVASEEDLERGNDLSARSAPCSAMIFLRIVGRKVRSQLNRTSDCFFLDQTFSKPSQTED